MSLILQKKKYTLRVRDEHSSNDGPQPMAFKSSPFGSSQQKKDKKESQPTDLRVLLLLFTFYLFNFGQ